MRRVRPACCARAASGRGPPGGAWIEPRQLWCLTSESADILWTELKHELPTRGAIPPPGFALEIIDLRRPATSSGHAVQRAWVGRAAWTIPHDISTDGKNRARLFYIAGLKLTQDSGNRSYRPGGGHGRRAADAAPGVADGGYRRQWSSGASGAACCCRSSDANRAHSAGLAHQHCRPLARSAAARRDGDPR